MDEQRSVRVYNWARDRELWVGVPLWRCEWESHCDLCGCYLDVVLFPLSRGRRGLICQPLNPGASLTQICHHYLRLMVNWLGKICFCPGHRLERMSLLVCCCFIIVSERMYVADAEMYGLYMMELLQNIFNTFSIHSCLLAHWTCPQNLIKVGILKNCPQLHDLPIIIWISKKYSRK